ncbi:TetR/AcrR family transcriptional regulator [Parasphingorhabdus sp.]|uniref:TetR/AcrR family transcriptional regulator n=1 Tax=Parasphingorhabdus sp. TaxID=2709688 RepID=UPI0032ECAFA9
MKCAAAPDQRRIETGRARREKTKSRLLEAAARLVAETGDAATTIETLITEAGLSRGTFYNYWPSRDALLDELWVVIGHDPFVSIQTSLADVTDPAERIATMARQAVLRANSDKVWGWLVVAIADRDPPQTHELFSFPEPDIQAGLFSNRFSAKNLSSATDVVVGATLSAMKRALRQGVEENYTSAVAAAILCSLGVPPKEATRIAQVEIPPVTASG